MLFAIGVFLHLVIPNEFGMTESQALMQVCAGKRSRQVGGGGGGGGGGTAAESLGTPIFSTEGSSDEIEAGRSADGADPEVGAEARRVESGEVGPADAAILVNNLRLEYSPGLVTSLRRRCQGPVGRVQKLAVDGLSLSVQHGECFGLLGPNGAGKTSAINILSGLILQSDGVAHVGGFDTALQMHQVHTILGVCPQFDTVWPDLTVEEHLLLYCRLKGVASADQPGLVQAIAGAIKLDGDPLRQPAFALSGGMRRRLSLGIALIANPQVVFLDEPSTGLDPETRRLVWEIVQAEREKGRCIILTTHSMEEADTLCTRIGIMAGGRLRSLGTQLELKRRHGTGYRLSFTMRREDDDVDEALLHELVCPTAALIYRFAKTRVYLLPTADTELSKVFGCLVQHKDDLGVREWGLSQATLEEAFIRIANLAGVR